MKLTKNYLAILCISVACVGCVAYGPASSEKNHQLIKNALPSDDNNTIVMGSAEWFPLTRGFSDFKSILQTGKKPNPKMGGLAVTDKTIYFAEWDESAKRYFLIKKIAINDIQEVILDKWGVNRRFSVQNPDLTFDSFAFISWVTDETDRTIKAFEYLKSVVKK